ncbi:invasion associated locus B family protein [Devosia sp.]|uniref:invasion associated locus B family protein n=1 Tax=Devosia sp. TaxID=1871048 RepID=UPI003A8E2119
MRWSLALAAAACLGLLTVVPVVPAFAQATAKPGEVFGDWVYECVAVGEGREACALNQSLVDQETGKLLVRFSLGRDEQNDTVSLVALVPLGIDFAAGVSGGLDDAAGFQMQLRTCLNTSCIAAARVDDAMLEKMKQGTTLKIGFKMMTEQQPRILGGSLRGITAGTKAAGF